MGGRDGWRLTKAVVMVAMMGMCLRMGGIPGTAGSWQLGRGEKHQRCMVRGQLGSQCSLGWCNHDPVTRVPWVGAMVEEGDLLGALSGWWMSSCSILFALLEQPRSKVTAASQLDVTIFEVWWAVLPTPPGTPRCWVTEPS